MRVRGQDLPAGRNNTYRGKHLDKIGSRKLVQHRFGERKAVRLDHLRAMIQNAAFHAARRDTPSDARTFLEEYDLSTGRRQTTGCRQSRKTGPHHRYCSLHIPSSFVLPGSTPRTPPETASIDCT